jgi:AraC-like DNA-binding protein
MRFVHRGPTGHDRATGVADRPTTGAIDDALRRLHLTGAVFLRAEYGEAWSSESLTGVATARLLRPGTDRVILFHVVAIGTCWVQVADGERHWASVGDVIVLPYGDRHRMGGVESAEPVPLASIMSSPPWPQPPVIRHGGPGRRTDLVCGFLHSDSVLFDPQLGVFPPAFVVRPTEMAAASWVRANIDYALAQTDASPLGGGGMSTRLPELLLVEILRAHLASAPARDDGWLAALKDPTLSPALAAMHADPGHKWTVTELADITAVSRSALDERFRLLLGRSPIRYLHEWRMHLARDLLRSTDLGVATVGHRVGYDAEEAFSRAFKRSVGSPPTTWRAGHPLR